MADQEAILNALRTVKDPELNVNVVDLGLVYTVQTRDDQVDVEMTLTTPGLPRRPGDPPQRRRRPGEDRGGHQGERQARDVPPWSPDRMSDEARDQLGIF